MKAKKFTKETILEIGLDKNYLETKSVNFTCSKLKNDAMSSVCKKIKPDLKFIGFLATDKPKRYEKILSGGYLQKKVDENICMPLAMLNKSEVFEILELFKISYVRKIYFDKENKLYKGDGACWFCSARCFSSKTNGRWLLLKKNFPTLWRKLKKYGLKQELLKLYNETNKREIKDAINFYFGDKNQSG
jgi:hypothetical protein